MQYTHWYQSPLGRVMLASDGEALTGLWFEGQAHFAETLPEGSESAALDVFDAADRWLDQYFSGIEPDFMPKLAPHGSAFRQAVWAQLVKIPFGKTETYGEIAARLAEEDGLPNASARAVGGAVAHNPISIFVPCHRVVGANGALTGYAGGVERKKKLLELEKARS